MSPPATIRAYCLKILMNGDLASKLARPVDAQGAPLSDARPGPALLIEHPVRNPGLRMQRGGAPLPRPGQLRDPEQRSRCLARFAHHELMAVELFAWALLRWPNLPAPLRRGLLSALVDEQRHCQLYLDRLNAHGGDFASDDHSDYFWQQIPQIAAAPNGPCAFLAAIGLTLEQANLDFTLTYRDAFAEAGDTESAAVCQTVHEEEIPHVALAARWLPRLATDATPSQKAASDDENAENDLALYLASVPFPLGPARAKGRRFEVNPRRKAGLSEALIEHVRAARSTQELASATENERKRP